MVLRMKMDSEEIWEVRDAGIPSFIVFGMAQGVELTEDEKEEIKRHGKVYVEAHKKDGKWVRPQLRDLPK